MEKRLVFPAKRKVQIESFERPEIGPDELGVRAIASLMSIGTENIIFNQIFSPGTHWESYGKLPFYPGYSAVGRVEELGREVKGFKVGDVVVMWRNHASFHAVKPDECSLVPSGIDPKTASWFALASIAFRGARVAEHSFRDTVLVIGGGPVGQMSLRWAYAAGCAEIIMVDSVESRLEFARKCSAHAIAKPIEEAEEDIRAVNGGALPDVVIDSTGNAKVFTSALKLTATRGRTVLLGDTGTPEQQRLSSDVLGRELSIRGAHLPDPQLGIPGENRTFFRMLETGRLPMDGMVSHVFQPEDAAKAYELVNSRRGEVMGLVFDWTK